MLQETLTLGQHMQMIAAPGWQYRTPMCCRLRPEAGPMACTMWSLSQDWFLDLTDERANSNQIATLVKYKKLGTRC